MTTEMFEKGTRIRTQVLGEAHVARSTQQVSDFIREFQTFATEWCWGAGWSRPGLELRERSLINLGMLTALGKPAELKLHVRGAINNGVTVEEIRETLIHASIYCGIPAALEAFKAADAVLVELAGESAGVNE